MPLDPRDPFFEGAVRNVIADELARSDLGVRIRQLQAFDAPAFTVATLPATGRVGQIVFVSDAGAGSKYQGWDGSAWVSLG